MDIRLIVIRSADPKELANFYSQLGFSFEYHQHGTSAMHYAANIDGTTLEIYPLRKGLDSADNSLRLGFGIDHFDQVIDELRDAKVVFSLEPTAGEFGMFAVVVDPEGRKIELYKN